MDRSKELSDTFISSIVCHSEKKKLETMVLNDEWG